MFNDLDAQLPFDRAPTLRVSLRQSHQTSRTAGHWSNRGAAARFSSRRFATNCSRVTAACTITIAHHSTKRLKHRMISILAPGYRHLRRRLRQGAGARVSVPPEEHAEAGPQVVVYFPGGDANLMRSSRDLRLRNVDFIIRSGRAVLFPVYQGTYERGPAKITGPASWNELVIARAKDFRRSIDYLVVRPDIDANRIGYYGLSLGGTMGVICTRSSRASRRACSPLADSIRWHRRRNRTCGTSRRTCEYRPSWSTGTNDFLFPEETGQLPLFRALGSPPGQKRHAPFDGGHIPPMHSMIKEILDWFDRFLGPVTPS